MKKFRKILKDGACEPISSADEKITQTTATPERKGKKRRRFAFKIMFVVSIVSIMLSVTYSWFSSSDTALANGVQIGVSEAKIFEFETATPYGVLEPLTGDGVYFFKPKSIGTTTINTVKDADGNDVQLDYSVNVYNAVSNAAENFNAAFDVSSVTLDPKSVNGVRILDITLKGSAGDEAFLVEGTELKASSASPAYLPGALRVAVLKLDKTSGKYATKVIWIPDITSTASGTSTLDEKFSYLSGVDGSSEEYEFTSTDPGLEVVDGITYVWGDIDGNNEASLGILSGSDDYRIVVWLDGNDREFDLNLLGEKFSATFKISPRTPKS